ncbi:MAG: VWA domain-containing protein [Chitinophagaceae bacterium]|nr:VWA domain-containing protein [Chitinophagaceae bacterium]
MQQLFKPAAVMLLILTSITILSFTNNSRQSTPVTKTATPKIQAAILLDVSGSMDGLIEQAKAQLWNMVNTMGKAKCDGSISPKIEIALYEYGRSTNDIKAGYVKLINGFISDLDSLSQNLFSLKTNGGDEYCGQVIFSSLNELKWDPSPESYKVIFIAGNEDFLQGSLHYTKACTEAKNKGVIVNTIYCGDKMQGIREHWNLAGECGNGSYTNINQNAKEPEIPTPYDSIIYALNDKLNGTYIAYGYGGASYQKKQAIMDEANTTMSKSAGLKRIQSKSNAAVYNNAQWDLVDAKDKGGELALEKINKQELPDSLKNKTTEELKKIVETKSKERSAVNTEIINLNKQRDAYIAAEKAKNAANKNNAPTLETEVEKIIKEQAKRYKMKID